MTSLDHAQVCVSGPAGAPTLLLIHGSTVTRAMWRPQIEALAGEFHMIAPDLPGHGTRAEQPFTLCSAVAQVDEVLARHATEPLVIVGISLGGYVAIEYAACHPEHVAGLVLASTTANFIGLLGTYMRVVGWVLGHVIDEERQRAKLARDIRRKYAPDIAEPLITAGLYPRAAGEGFLELAGRDFLDLLAAIDRPVLL